MFITHNLIIVGQPAIASCISSIETTCGTIKEWLHNEGVIVSTILQLSNLTWCFLLSMIASMAKCMSAESRTGEDGEIAEKNFTVKR